MHTGQKQVRNTNNNKRDTTNPLVKPETKLFIILLIYKGMKIFLLLLLENHAWNKDKLIIW